MFKNGKVAGDESNFRDEWPEIITLNYYTSEVRNQDNSKQAVL